MTNLVLKFETYLLFNNIKGEKSKIILNPPHQSGLKKRQSENFTVILAMKTGSLLAKKVG
jgi:hypothetical protein